MVLQKKLNRRKVRTLTHADLERRRALERDRWEYGDVGEDGSRSGSLPMVLSKGKSTNRIEIEGFFLEHEAEPSAPPQRTDARLPESKKKFAAADKDMAAGPVDEKVEKNLIWLLDVLHTISTEGKRDTKESELEINIPNYKPVLELGVNRGLVERVYPGGYQHQGFSGRGPSYRLTQRGEEKVKQKFIDEAREAYAESLSPWSNESRNPEDYREKIMEALRPDPKAFSELAAALGFDWRMGPYRRLINYFEVTGLILTERWDRGYLGIRLKEKPIVK